MNTIYVPTFPAFSKDVETMLGILTKYVPRDRFDIGLEIGGRPEHFESPESLEKIVKNIKSIAGGIKTIVHGFSGLSIYEKDNEPSHIADISREEGMNLLHTYIGLAKELGSQYVHVHGSMGYRGITVPNDKNVKLNQAKVNLLNGLNYSNDIPIGIENLPTPSACDFDSNPNTVWSDYVQGIEDCLYLVQDTPLKVTFDTSHYGINQNGYVDLVSACKQIGGHLGHIHAVDCSGYWEPGVSKAYDGSIPGDGRIGRDSFENFFKYIGQNHPNMSVCLEIRPSDFKNPVPEFAESIKRVCNWLSL